MSNIGPFAFYKGLTASYVGIVESLIQLGKHTLHHFNILPLPYIIISVSYEKMKSMAQEYKYGRMKDHQKEAFKLKNPISPHKNGE